MAFAQGLDKGIVEMAQAYIGVLATSWTDLGKELVCMLMRKKDCGLREAKDRRFGKFMGVFV